MLHMYLLTVLVAVRFFALRCRLPCHASTTLRFSLTGLTCRRVVMLRGCPPGRDPAPFATG